MTEETTIFCKCEVWKRNGFDILGNSAGNIIKGVGVIDVRNFGILKFAERSLRKKIKLIKIPETSKNILENIFIYTAIIRFEGVGTIFFFGERVEKRFELSILGKKRVADSFGSFGLIEKGFQIFLAKKIFGKRRKFDVVDFLVEKGDGFFHERIKSAMERRKDSVIEIRS